MQTTEKTDGDHSDCSTPTNHCLKPGCKVCQHKEQSDGTILSSLSEDCMCDPSTCTCDCDSCLLGISDHMACGDAKQKVPQILSWSTLRSVMRVTFFTSKNASREWTQLGGHKGGFCQGMQNDTILKLFCPTESECLQQLMTDELQPFVPQFRGQVSVENQAYLEMQDLLYDFNCPALMDCKIGSRTYLEKELAKARMDPELRHDLYAKMIEVDSNAPSEEERANKAVTKVRYMQWRESISSTSSLSFRIEGIKIKSQVHDPNFFKTVKSYEEVKQNMRLFFGCRRDIIQRYVQRLKELRECLDRSAFFSCHELVGSSLLFVHDDSGKASIWMIDFGKTTKLSKGVSITHSNEWIEGNHEDGYLTGFGNVTRLLKELLQECDS